MSCAYSKIILYTDVSNSIFRGKKDLIKKILVALDGSEHANHALDFALDLAEKYSASIVLLSVYHPEYILLIDETDYIAPQATEKYLDALKAYHEKVLSEGLKKAKKLKPNLKVSTKLLEGRPADKIIVMAKEGNFNFIVVGRRGLGGIGKFFLGSISDRVADQAPCPVLIVR